MYMHNIGIIGLGYIGLPLSIAFSKNNKVIGYDLNPKRINQLNKGVDINKEFKSNNILNKNLIFKNDINALKFCYVYIIAVPTPIYNNKKPNLKHINSACKLVAKILQKNDIIIFESTVYPGLTENYCAPLIEKYSKLIFNKDFFCGYSPERINPGDRKNTLKNIVKITSGSDNKTSKFVDRLYSSIIKAGTKRVSSIKIAEAAKVIENSQRDLNIAFINELSIIFNKMNLNLIEILEAAETKWNFMPFRPGLVGGHCIGVDPYYLTHISKINGYKPQVILAGRSLNDSMYLYLVKNFLNNLKKKRKNIKKSKILIMGITFKENSTDIRNSKVFKVFDKLIEYVSLVHMYDPLVDATLIDKRYKKNIINNPSKNYYDAVLITVPHDIFIKMTLKKIKSLLKPNGIIFDYKKKLKK